MTTTGTAAPAPGLHGRTREQAALRAALDDAAAGHDGLVVLTGEAGIGKTALARDLAAQAGAAGAVVRWSSAWEGAGEEPYGCWLQLAGGPEPLPDLAAALAGEARVPGPEAAPGARHDAHERAVAALDAAGRRAPQLLVVDDLHWADASTTLLVHHLIGRLSGLPVLLVATVREDEVPAGSVLARVLAGAERVPVAGLSASAGRALLATTLGTEPSDDLVTRVLDRAHGNPLFVTELGRLLAASPSARRLPDQIRDVLTRRLVHLPDRTRHLLRVAAVIGTAFDVRLLAEVVGDPVGDVMAVLEPAEAARVVTTVDPRCWTFSHALVREALVDEPARRSPPACTGRSPPSWRRGRPGACGSPPPRSPTTTSGRSRPATTSPGPGGRSGPAPRPLRPWRGRRPTATSPAPSWRSTARPS